MLFAASCAASPVALQAPSEAEALFKKMEATLAAKTLKVKFTSAVEFPATPEIKLEGSLSLEEGNKATFEVGGKAGPRTYTLKIACDGAKITQSRTEMPPPPDLGPLPPPAVVAAPASLNANLAAALARGGAWLVQDYFDAEYRTAADRHFKSLQGTPPGAPPKETVVAELHELRNFVLDKKEKVRDRNSQAIKYDMHRVGETLGIFTTITVWIDAETSLPLKREGKIFTTMKLTVNGKESVTSSHASTWVETYP